ncbi:MAG: hypothetical protein ABI877_01750 [Gemmatimonadaceae bacterium]
MRATLTSLVLVATLAACGARAVTVESAPATAPAITLTVTNGLTQAVNVYVVTGNTDRFVQQVAAKSTASLSVAGVSTGAIVQLKATTADGTKTYTKDGVALQTSNSWTVP